MTDDARADHGYRYPVEVLHILVSPGHNYFGRPKDGPGTHPTTDLAEAAFVTGQGIVGDRFFGKAAHLDAAVTLFAFEALEAVRDALALPSLPSPLLTRRNVVLRGADLNGLIGHDFRLLAPGSSRPEGGGHGVGGHGVGGVTLHGGRPAAPCAWMDRMIAPGAHAALRGRGGIRCGVVDGGLLRRGPATLVSPVALDPSAAGRAALRARPLP